MKQKQNERIQRNTSPKGIGITIWKKMQFYRNLTKHTEIMASFYLVFLPVSLCHLSYHLPIALIICVTNYPKLSGLRKPPFISSPILVLLIGQLGQSWFSVLTGLASSGLGWDSLTSLAVSMLLAHLRCPWLSPHVSSFSRKAQWSQGFKRGNKNAHLLFKFFFAFMAFVDILLAKASHMAKFRVSVEGHYQRVWLQRGLKNWGY